MIEYSGWSGTPSRIESENNAFVSSSTSRYVTLEFATVMRSQSSANTPSKLFTRFGRSARHRSMTACVTSDFSRHRIVRSGFCCLQLASQDESLHAVREAQSTHIMMIANNAYTGFVKTIRNNCIGSDKCNLKDIRVAGAIPFTDIPRCLTAGVFLGNIIRRSRLTLWNLIAPHERFAVRPYDQQLTVSRSFLHE